ncbi:MAG: hypothetical protein ACI9MB_000792 [Verrucomicrobiales bacterium]|jgi:hypothetical protein
MKLSTKIYTAAVLLSLPASSLAGEPMTTPPTEPKAAGSGFSGVISLDVNTHFISYGADIWGAGSEWADALFNPFVEISFALNDNLTLSVGTWWDVNDNASSNIDEWALNAGVTYYYTSSDVIPNNPDESFVTGSLGVSVSF